MRIVGKILKWIAIVIILLAVVGAIYEQVGEAMDAKLAPPESEMITVEGRQVHFACMGEGPRAFVLDPGLGGWSVFWWRLQPLLANSGRTCTVDRAGEGWSDATGGAHDAEAAADELASIIAAAGITAPFFYVGHSLGANFAQVYYAKYPDQIAGLVLLEPGNPKDLLEDFEGTRNEAMSAPDCNWMCNLAGAAGYLGLTRLIAAIAPGEHFPGVVKDQYRTGLARPSHWMNNVALYLGLPKTAYQVLDVTTFDDTPVLLLNSSEPREPEGDETPSDVEIWRKGYLAYLASLAAKSSRGIGPVEVPQSSHAYMVLDEAPATFVAQTIADFAAQAEARPD